MKRFYPFSEHSEFNRLRFIKETHLSYKKKILVNIFTLIHFNSIHFNVNQHRDAGPENTHIHNLMSLIPY